MNANNPQTDSSLNRFTSRRVDSVVLNSVVNLRVLRQVLVVSILLVLVIIVSPEVRTS